MTYSPLRTAFKLSLPVLGAYWFLGITYGLLAANMGYGIWVPIVMAMVIYSGSVEFIALTLLIGSFHPMAAWVMAFMVGARHLFYGVSMLDQYRGAGWKKPFLIYWLTDETFAINFSSMKQMKSEVLADLSNHSDIDASHRADPLVFSTCLWISLLDYLYWISGGIMGYLLGASLGETLMQYLEGLDFVVTAMFVAIFMDDYMRNKATHLSSWLGIGAALVCLLLFGAQQFIIPSMLCILIALYINYKKNNP